MRFNWLQQIVVAPNFLINLYFIFAVFLLYFYQLRMDTSLGRRVYSRKVLYFHKKTVQVWRLPPYSSRDGEVFSLLPCWCKGKGLEMDILAFSHHEKCQLSAQQK